MIEGNGSPRLKAQNYIIKRPRLTKVLDESEARIILLCAPAGYGKTTLAREWAETSLLPTLWHATRPTDTDSAGLASRLAALYAPSEAKRRDAVERVENLASHAQPLESLALCIAEIAGSDEKLLIIDDYHFVDDSVEAEALLLEVIRVTPGRVLLSSRSRPSWASARALMYHDLELVEQRQLAFTAAEAEEVLARRTPRASAALLEVAQGWPAVIGMAAVQGARGAANSLTARTLYDFFVEDLFGSASEDLQDGLLLLACGADASVEIARRALSTSYDEVLQGATARGFVSHLPDGSFRVHPLLREFLLTRLSELGHRRVTESVRIVVAQLSKAEQWDDCLTLLQRFPDPELTTSVLTSGLMPLLTAGRITTVRHWLELAHRTELEQPIVLLAAAELALREGRHNHAQELASRAAKSLGEGDLAARAFLTAARAAHLNDDLESAAEAARASHQLATENEVAQEALWLAFITSLEGQLPDVDEHLESLTRLEGSNPRLALRLACAEALHAFEHGRLERALNICERGEALLGLVRDPLQSTGFLNIFAHIVYSAGNYMRALELVDRLLGQAHSAGLDFPVGYALATRAGALVSTRQLGAARRALNEVQRHRNLAAHVVGAVTICAAKLRVAAGDLERASAELDAETPRASRAMVGELLAYRGLVLASRGLAQDAARTLSQAEQASRYVEATNIVTISRAVLALTAGDDDAQEVANRSIRDALATGTREIVVTASRAHPPLLNGCAQDEFLARPLASLLAASHDADLARRCGLRVARELTRGQRLSAREVEVYELVAQGQTNRQIANTLFISESTAKVHVRHIFEKLGVHSRAEVAAMQGEGYVSDD